MHHPLIPLAQNTFAEGRPLQNTSGSPIRRPMAMMKTTTMTKKTIRMRGGLFGMGE